MALSSLAFTLGWLMNDPALSFLGGIFLMVFSYCLLGVLVLGFMQKYRAESISVTIINGTVRAGENVELVSEMGNEAPFKGRSFFKNSFFRLPAVIFRCELCLKTMDGRVIRHYFDPGKTCPAGENKSSFRTMERGAYSSAPQGGGGFRLLVFDALGFFRLAFPVKQSPAPELFTVPSYPFEAEILSLKSGGRDMPNEANYLKSDNLTDHRPYVPGDDPRRINWKLYSHAPLGGLFVREGEPLPPPHSRLAIVIDGYTDPLLYSEEEGRRAVDVLCENALAAALEIYQKGMEVLIDDSAPLDPEKIALYLARPYSSASMQAELPPVSQGTQVLVMALPRTVISRPWETGGISALDRFLKTKLMFSQGGTDIIFIHDSKCKKNRELEKAADLCVMHYNGINSAVFAARVIR